MKNYNVVLAKRIKKLRLRALITFLYVLSYNLLTQSWFCIAYKLPCIYAMHNTQLTTE